MRQARTNRQPDRCSDYGKHNETAYTALDVLLSVLDESGKVVAERRNSVEREISPEQMDAFMKGGLAFEDSMMILPGDYTVNLIVRNKVAKVFYLAREEIEVPPHRARNLKVLKPILFNRSKTSPSIQPNSIPPFAFYNTKFHPTMRPIPRGQEIGVFYQIQAPPPGNGAGIAGVRVTYRLLDKQDAVVDEISGELVANSFNELGLASAFWKFKTDQLDFGEYRLEISATLGDSSAKAYSKPIVISNEGPAAEPTTAYGRYIDFSSPEPTLEKGRQLISLGKSKPAVNLLASAMKRWPASNAVAALYSEALIKTGKLDEAKDVLLELSLRDQDEPRWKRNLGMLQLQTGQFNKAIGFLEQARLLEGDTVEVLNPLGEAYRFAGKNEKAKEIWQRSLEIDPEQPLISRRLEHLEQAPVENK